MTRSTLRNCASTLALAAACWALPATAQQQPAGEQAPVTDTPPAVPAPGAQTAGDPVPAANTAPAPTPADAAPPALGDDIVVTATAGDRSRFRSSISVSQVSQESIANFTPRSEAEALRSIPGLQPSDTAGPGGNANIGVRGIPVSTGGSEYVALQEDGLPVTLFGDMNFGNNDYWLRFDQNVERLEAVRGGSASTFTSQAPGAVVNYISKTGDRAGGSAAYSNGLGFREHRVDFDYGAPINDTLRFHIGGYARNGGGLTNENFNILRGYQIKANVTKDFADNRGFIRLLFKRLDEQAPTNTTTPSLATIKGNKVVGFEPLPTFDGRDGSSYSIYKRGFQVLNNAGRIENVEVQGIHPKVTTFGAQLHYEFGDTLTFDNAIRYSDISGNFTTQFLNVQTTASLIGSTVNGATVGSIRYAAGPRLGQAYTGTYVNNNPNINTRMSNMDNFVNNMTLSKKFALGEATVRTGVGWFHMNQKIGQDWYVNRQYSELSGENSAPIDLFSTTGTQLTAAGQAGFNDNWGTCCRRTVDLSYTDDAPFLSLNYSGGGLELDASVRYDTVSGKGTARGGMAGPSFRVSDALGSALLPSLVASTTVENIDYRKDYTSWSLGALYAFNTQTSVFARVSRGGRFNADRLVLSGNFAADGSLTQSGQNVAVNFLQQQEVGIKQRGEIGTASYTMEITGFRSTLTENNYDFTRINNPAPNNNPNISNSYKSYGIEFTGRLNAGDFHLAADGTFIKSKITKSATAALVDKRPGGQPELLFSVSPSYDNGFLGAGLSFTGQTSTPLDDFNTFYAKGSTFVSGFLKVRPIENVEVGLNVNNLFDKLGFRGGGNLNPVLSPTSAVFNNTALYGRTVTGSVRYKF